MKLQQQQQPQRAILYGCAQHTHVLLFGNVNSEISSGVNITFVKEIAMTMTFTWERVVTKFQNVYGRTSKQYIPRPNNV